MLSPQSPSPEVEVVVVMKEVSDVVVKKGVVDARMLDGE
jgi:hypothetical protein